MGAGFFRVSSGGGLPAAGPEPENVLRDARLVETGVGATPGRGFLRLSLTKQGLELLGCVFRPFLFGETGVGVVLG